MFKSKISMFLTILIVLFTCTYAYGVTYYSGIPFSNSASDGDIATWTNSGKWEWVGGATFRTSIGLGTGDSPQFAGIEITGALTISAGALTDNTVTSDDIHWAEPITVPFDNYINFGDTGIYIGSDDDTILDIVADVAVDISNLRLATNGSFGNYDITLADKISGFDANNFIDFGADGRLVIQADGAGTPFATPDIDVTGTSYFDADMGLPIDTKVYFGDADVFIESDDDGYLDIDADTGIRLNSDVSAETLTTDPSSAPSWKGYDSDVNDDQVVEIIANGDDTDSDVTFKAQVATSMVEFLRLDGQDETVVVSKPIAAGANAITTTGIISGGSLTPLAGTAADFDDNFTGANLYGGTYRVTTAGVAPLPNAAVGMNFTITDAGDTPTIEPLATGTDDTIILNETTCGQGKYIISDGTTGNMAVFQYGAADTWIVYASGFTCEL